MAVDTIIRGGRLVTAERTLDTSIAIDDGEIVAIGAESAIPQGDRIIDATDLLVLPGVVDPHTHIDEVPDNRAGSYRTETAAAALGGITTLVDFAYQGGDRSLSDPDATLLDGIDHKKGKASQSHIDFSVHGVLHRDDPTTFEAISDAIEAGVTSFKMFLSTYDVGVDNDFLVDAFAHLAEHNAVAALHAEDPKVCDRLAKRFEIDGLGIPSDYPDSRPDYVEAMALEDALHLAQAAGVKYYAVHTTARISAETLDRFQSDYSRVRGETCTHYTVLDESAHERQGNLPKIAPPLRTPDDVEAMFESLRDGTLSVVSSDHVVYKRETKDVAQWWNSPFGCNSLQRSLPVFHDEAINKRGHSYPFLVRKMCTNPAQIFGLPRKGTLKPGTDADVILFDPDKEVKITSRSNASNADYSIYDGTTVTGAVETTILRGKVVVEDGHLVGEPGDGRFVEREIPDWGA